MISAWRLLKKHHQANALDGEGARRFGGRWNRIGTPLIYTSESLALSALEYFVHLDIPSNLDLLLVAIKISIPKDLIHSLDTKKIPKNWQQNPPPLDTQIIGSEWVEKNSSTVLKVPSILIPTEYNYLLNPNHPFFNQIKTEETFEFKYDDRMFKRV